MNTKKYYYLIALGIFSISLSPIMTRYAESSSLVIAANRMLYTILLLTPFTLKRVIHEGKSLSKATLGLNLLSGFFLGLHFWAWIDALQNTSVANATILVNLHPMFILLISGIVLRESVDSKSMVSTLMALTGSTLIVYNSLATLSLNPKGDLMAILGAFFVAVYLVIGAKVRQRISNPTYTYTAYATAFFTLLVLGFFFEARVFSYPLSDAYVFLGLAAVPTLLGHSLFNLSLKAVDPHLVSIAILGEPILATLWAFFLFKEGLVPLQFLGGLLIVAALLYKVGFLRRRGPSEDFD
jgi:drug/metabolite transporter (DMT)-like permease